MTIDWQTVFYIIASIWMLMSFILVITLFILVIMLASLIKRIHSFFDTLVTFWTDVGNFKKGTLITILDLIRKIIKKGEKNYGK